MAPSMPQFNPARMRSYVFRLPLFTRLVLLIVAVSWIVGIQSMWDIVQWGALIPKDVGLTTTYRLNTFPLVHVNFLHALINLLALAPLLERFEADHGTLVTLALFFGPLSTLPGVMYLLVERAILRGNTTIMGASVWVSVLLAIEAMKAYRSNPNFSIGPYKIPTWTTPLVALLVVTFLIPNTSLLGHLCGAAVGYLFGLGYMKFLAPPEKILRWVERKMNLLGRLPHYVSVDQKTYGRYGVLPTTAPTAEGGAPLAFMGSSQRLGP
ncbi:MAG: putative rhomboid protease [Thelocarpon impressellum]|nr:MAG: putative rhomboid protease [Thelocarpon impressellum]